MNTAKTDNSSYRRVVMVTGGAGFIGSHLVRRLVTRYPEYLIVNYDALTYAGRPENVADVADAPNYRFVHADIADRDAVADTFGRYGVTDVINLAAESHVDRSIDDPLLFARTNVLGTLTLLDAARRCWTDGATHRFYQVSTDEVYGSLPLEGGEHFTETSPYNPHSPYSASKASADHFVRAYHDTYGLPTLISNCSNNYGPDQYPEKLIPLFVTNIIERKPLPVYGEGLNVRDWLYVTDHAAAIDLIFHQGLPGRTYNIGGNNELSNITLIRSIIAIADELLGRPEGDSLPLITHVTDRPGHDLRYAIDATRLTTELGWHPTAATTEALRATVRSIIDSHRSV